MGNSALAGSAPALLQKLAAMGQLLKSAEEGDITKYGQRNFKFSECFDPMTVQIKPLEEAQRAIEARKWIFSSKHEKLVGRLGKVVECDKRDRSILVEHNDGVSEWWCAEALLRRVKATCKSEHPLSEFSCDRREFTCDDCEGREQKTYDGNMCYMFGCRLCDFDVCDHCASMRHENILERVEAVERLQLATAKAGKAIRYKPSAQEVSPEDAEAYEEKESDSGPESEKSIDTANYPELEATVQWLGRKIELALHHISFDHEAVTAAIRLKQQIESALKKESLRIEADRIRVAAEAKKAKLEKELQERAEAREAAAREAERVEKELVHKSVVEEDLRKLGANNIGCLYVPVNVRGVLMSWICTNIGCTKLFRTGPMMLMHQQLDCPMRRVMCDFGCGVFMPHQNLDAHCRVCPFQQRGGSDETFRKLLLHDPEAESKQLEQKLCRLFDAADTQKRGMLDMVDMKRMYKSVSGSDATALVVKHQIERADTNQNGFLDRSEFLAFSLPIFSSFEFSAAAQLIDSFTAACTVVSSTAEELILKQYEELRQERENAMRRVARLYEVDPKEKTKVDTEYRDLATYLNLLRTQMEEELNDFAAANGIRVNIGTDGHAVLDRSSDALAAPE